jgi:NAD(P)-dependent dehydrogenase (short-subunit alcohol dehydrogenase family)
MENSLEDKRILLVGGSSGIGLSVAKQVSQLGAKIMIASRTAAECQNTFVGILGEGISTFSCDIISEQDVNCLIEAVDQIDHLVITVRPDIKPAFFRDMNIDYARQAFESKFWGPYRLIQLIHSHINPGGSIIMTSGIAGEKIFKGSSTMGIINSAVETLCRSLAVELAPIRVNAVSPGFVEPKIKEIQTYALQFPQPRLASLQEIAQAFICLMTNNYLTGTIMVVDGGARLI